MAKPAEVKRTIYVVAGRYEQARRCVQERIAGGERGVRYQYVSRAERLRGLSFGPEDVVFTGTYWENPEFTAITRQLNMIHAFHKDRQK